MELFKISLLFLVVHSSPSSPFVWRRPSAAKTNGFFELVTRSSEFTEFYGELQAEGLGEFTKHNARKRSVYALFRFPRTSEFSYVSRMTGNLSRMVYRFMVRSHDYVKRQLLEFCRLATRLMDGQYAENEIREVLGFPNDCVYCLITAIDDVGIYGDVLLEPLFFFRAIDGDAQCPLGDLKTALSLYNERFDALEKNDSRPRPLRVTAGHDDVVQRMRTVKREIGDFSKMFCSQWAPFVSHVFLSRTVLEEVRDESRFIRHVYLSERCLYTRRTEKSADDVIIGWWNYKWTFSRNCGHILETQEYGYKEYEKSLNPKKLAESERSEPETVDGRELFSLAELKQLLQSNIYFRNALKYYETVSDVLLTVSMKESDKIFRGIKLVARWSCSERNNDQTADTIRGLRFTLTAFKSVCDELVSLIERERFFDANFDRQKEAFAERVSWLVQLLDARNDDAAAQRSCEEILEYLKQTNVDGRAYPVGDPINVMKFRVYYFDEPLIHMRQLYRFIMRGF